MANSAWYVRAEQIANLRDKDFEDFCFKLLDLEVQRRHVNATCEGPGAPYHRDDGMDLYVNVDKPPRIVKADWARPLTEDDLAETCVSCKSGHSWHQKFTADAREPKKAPLEVLRSGGHFTMMVNQKVAQQPDTETLLNDVSAIFSTKLGEDPQSVRTRIHFYDADDLAAFLAHHPIVFDALTRSLLGIPDLQGLQTFDVWRNFLQEDRSLPEFCADDLRQSALRQVGTLLARLADHGKSEVAWIYGPPGAGKSRLVFEAISRMPGGHQRALVAPTFEYGRKAVGELQVPQFNDVVLIIDDCPPSEIQAISALFLARAQGNNATLLLIGPQAGVDDPPRFMGLPLRVKPLEGPATQRLVEQELAIGFGERSDLVQRVLRLSEGYPWFAILLARAAREDPRALPTGADQWMAASLAMAGPTKEYQNEESWKAEVIRRAKTLFAVMLTEGIDWTQLQTGDQERLGKVLEMPWAEIKAVAEMCWKRGIIRVRQDWKYKYVTPNNLSRLVAAHLLQPPFSLGQNIRDHAPELRGSLHQRLRALEVNPSILTQLAAEELQRAREALLPFGQSAGGLPLSFAGFAKEVPLAFTARWCPGATAHSLRTLIESAGLEELRQRTDVRRDLVFALEHISRRREGFEDAEAALFRLAIAENETWANNASGVWSGLFHFALNLTHRTSAVRLAILRGRLAAGSAEFRKTALSGLATAVSSERVGPGYTDEDTVDGPWVKETVGEIQAAKRESWKLLAALTADSDPEIATQARKVAVENLRSNVWWGIGASVLADLIGAVGAWSEKEIAGLREELDEIRAYEKGVLDEDERLAAVLETLSKVVQPKGLHDLLADVVGRWLPGDPSHGDGIVQYHEELDEELAMKALAQPDQLIDELAWLDSEDAVRSTSFMVHVGRLDSSRVLLEPLVSLALSGGAANILSAYLVGLASWAGEAEVDALLSTWRGDPTLALHTLMTICRLGPSDQRVEWIIEDLESGHLDPRQAGSLALGSWASRGSAEAISKLIRILSRLASTEARVVALDLIVDRADVAPSETASLECPLLQLLESLASERLPGMASHTWKRACELALSAGHVARVIPAAIRAISGAEDYGDRDAWDVLCKAQEVDPVSVWDALGRIIESRDKGSVRVLLEAQTHGVLSRVPEDAVMSWIGDDARRSLLVAHMCTAHESPLNELARQLIIRFGPDSPAGNSLGARAMSTQGAVWGSLVSFYEAQLEKALQWAQDPDPKVAEWGTRMVEQLRAASEAESAREEFEERHGL